MCLKAATISYVNTGFCPQLTISRLQRVFGTGNALTCLYSLICWPTAPWSPTNLNYKRGYAAKSLQSCPTLCNPRDSSPPGSPSPGILQARTLEWVAISFSSAWKWKWSRSVVSNSSRSHGLQPTRLLHPWDFPGKSTGVGCRLQVWHCSILPAALWHGFYPAFTILQKKRLKHRVLKQFAQSSLAPFFFFFAVWLWVSYLTSLILDKLFYSCVP